MSGLRMSSVSNSDVIVCRQLITYLQKGCVWEIYVCVWKGRGRTGKYL